MQISRFFAIAALVAASAAAQTDFQLKDQDTVVFYGDSITDQRLYTTFVETYVLTRFPQRRIRFVHSGWGGDRVGGGAGGPIDLRLQRDVFAYKPTVMTIMLGMNDGGYKAMDEERFKKFTDGYEHIIDATKQAFPNVRITVIQPSPYDDVTRPVMFEGGYNSVLLSYSDYLRQLAERRKLMLADLNGPVTTMLTKANTLDPASAAKIIPDRVHPGPSGHLAMAQALLEAWNAPTVVTAVEIDATGGRTLHADNTKVEEFQGGDKLTWTQQDLALPMPVDAKDPLVALVLRSSGFEDELNREMLTVRGLAADRYSLSINGVPVGSFSREELDAGVNLATMDTPMTKQAQMVHALTLKHTGIHNTRWRNVQTPLKDDSAPHIAEALTALDRLEDDLIAEQRMAAQPQPCHYELTPEVKQ